MENNIQNNSIRIRELVCIAILLLQTFKKMKSKIKHLSIEVLDRIHLQVQRKERNYFLLQNAICRAYKRYAADTALLNGLPSSKPIPRTPHFVTKQIASICVLLFTQ